MLIKQKPTNNSNRHYVRVSHAHLHDGAPEKTLLAGGHLKRQGRGASGHITVRHRGGGVKKRLRVIDWKRDKRDIVAIVQRIEYDPVRSANIALLFYKDGEKRYILAPEGMEAGQEVMAGQVAEVKAGNSMPLKNVPVGVPIHNIETRVGKGGQLVGRISITTWPSLVKLGAK